MLSRKRTVRTEIPVSVKLPDPCFVTLSHGLLGNKMTWQIPGYMLQAALKRHFTYSSSPISASYGMEAPVFAKWTAKGSQVEEQRLDS